MLPHPPLRRPSATIPLKKRLHHSEEPEYEEELPVEKTERVEVEHNDPYIEGEEGWKNVSRSTSRNWEMGRTRDEEQEEGERRSEEQNSGGRGYMMNNEDEEVDVDIDAEEEEMNFREEQHRAEMEGFKEVRRDVVNGRRKRNEFEVFVGGLDREADERDLREIFSTVGDITEVRLMKNPLTQKNKGFAFIRYATIEQCKRAVAELKHPVINGKQCGVAPSQDSDTLFIGNICRTWTDEMLKEKLIRYGIENFEEVTLVEDTKNEGMNRGFAFLDFSSRAAAVEAVKRLQKRDVVFGTDRTARVSFADTFIEPDDEIMSQVRAVFIDGLPSSWEEDRIKEHLKRFGRIEKVELARNMVAAKRDDFGFVTFYSHEDAVACIDGINDSEIVSGTKKMKVRARLSRPRQRGKSAKQARGGYPIGRVGSRDSDDSYRSCMETSRYSNHDERGNPSRRIYDRDLPPRSLEYRDRRTSGDYVADRTSSRREYSPPDRSFRPRVSSSYGLKRDGMREGDSFGRAHDFAREKNTYREAYISHGSEYLEDSPRRGSRLTARRVSPVYEDERYSYIEHSSNYSDKHGRDYTISRLKRPYSSMEDAPPRYAEPSIKQTRSRVAYVTYADGSYGDDSARPVQSSRSGYDGSRRSGPVYARNTSNMGYRRGEEIGREDAEEMYSSRYGRDPEPRGYVTSRSEMTADDSYPPAYTTRRMTDDRVGGRDSGSYY